MTFLLSFYKCIYCGKDFNNINDVKTTQDLRKQLIAHDKECPKNPIVAENKRLKDQLREGQCCTSFGMCGDAYERLQAKIKQLKAELDKHRWIPVTEDSPPAGKKRILVLWSNGYVDIDGIKCPGDRDSATHWKPIILPKDEK